jgi:hypothetical protein
MLIAIFKSLDTLKGRPTDVIDPLRQGTGKIGPSESTIDDVNIGILD